MRWRLAFPCPRDSAGLTLVSWASYTPATVETGTWRDCPWRSRRPCPLLTPVAVMCSLGPCVTWTLISTPAPLRSRSIGSASACDFLSPCSTPTGHLSGSGSILSSAVRALYWDVYSGIVAALNHGTDMLSAQSSRVSTPLLRPLGSVTPDPRYSAPVDATYPRYPSAGSAILSCVSALAVVLPPPSLHPSWFLHDCGVVVSQKVVPALCHALQWSVMMNRCTVPQLTTADKAAPASAKTVELCSGSLVDASHHPIVRNAALGVLSSLALETALFVSSAQSHDGSTKGGADMDTSDSDATPKSRGPGA